jgi:hypothetical protein
MIEKSHHSAKKQRKRIRRMIDGRMMGKDFLKRNQ